MFVLLGDMEAVRPVFNRPSEGISVLEKVFSHGLGTFAGYIPHKFRFGAFEVDVQPSNFCSNSQVMRGTANNFSNSLVVLCMYQDCTVIYECDIQEGFWRNGLMLGEVNHSFAGTNPWNLGSLNYPVFEIMEDPAHTKVKKDVRYRVAGPCTSGGEAWFTDAFDAEVREMQQILQDVL